MFGAYPQMTTCLGVALFVVMTPRLPNTLAPARNIKVNAIDVVIQTRETSAAVFVRKANNPTSAKAHIPQTKRIFNSRLRLLIRVLLYMPPKYTDSITNTGELNRMTVL